MRSAINFCHHQIWHMNHLFQIHLQYMIHVKIIYHIALIFIIPHHQMYCVVALDM